MFPAPWKHILACGLYSQKKAQTLSSRMHDPPKNALTPQVDSFRDL